MAVATGSFNFALMLQDLKIIDLASMRYWSPPSISRTNNAQVLSPQVALQAGRGRRPGKTDSSHLLGVNAAVYFRGPSYMRPNHTVTLLKFHSAAAACSLLPAQAVQLYRCARALMKGEKPCCFDSRPISRSAVFYC
ncbi:uncharacterized protein BBA_07652 [Beauveria bassiana ARSEF 2860]|uniref:Uncharacterized protein n=1 Tax=Beauveria bassiana (strain ARSEF 2860) TaxID=655819 RepID=J5JJI5_BEAB2|nr:uncharacterized protein BBA_07652 [Beauveria bassiana ARSEF 2860]EJP63476.1 hypothetical protein BBA_07652 [Beauveria bassiana ARSEF 2860]